MDKLLSQLIKKLYKYPIGSPEYREALEHLLSLIPHLQGICQDRHPDYSKAVDQSSEDIRQKIDGFIVTLVLKIDETPPSVLRENFVRWVNRFLRFDIYDLYRSRKLPLSLDNTRAGEEGGTTFIEQLPDPRTLDNWLEQEEAQTQRLVLKRYVEKDPDGILRKCYPTNYPQCNCQVLAKMRYLNETTLGVPALAKQFGMSAQTIYSHWKRSCLPILQEIADNYHQYLYLLKPVPLNQWFENFFDTGWHTLESIFGAGSPHLVRSRTRTADDVRLGKLIDLGMQLAGNPVALVVVVALNPEGELGILLRLYPTGEQECLPPNLQLVVLDESGETFLEAQSRNADNWIQLQFSGVPGESFSVKVALGDASVIEDFVI